MESITNTPFYLAVEGVIGVGKTTLARLLREAFGYNNCCKQCHLAIYQSITPGYYITYKKCNYESIYKLKGKIDHNEEIKNQFTI